MNLFIFKLVKEILFFFSFIFSLFSLMEILFNQNLKKKKIFLQPEGGFAHTILSPEVLKRIFDKKKWLLIFGYNPRRHNYLTCQLYENHFTWLYLSLPIVRLSYIKSFYKKLIFKILEKILKFKKIEFEYYVDFIANYQGFNHKKINEKYNKEGLLLHEYNAYKIFSLKDKTQVNDLNSFKVKNFYIRQCSRKICGFGFKQKNAHKYTNERSSDNIENFKSSFEEMVDQGWDIYLYGDYIEKLPDTFNYFEKNIFTAKKMKLSRDEFNLKAGLLADCYIGPSSGASSWKYIFHNKPQLILDSYPIGWCFYNSLISFKIITSHLNLRILNEILDDKIYILNEPPFKTRYTNIDEKKKIISNYIKSIDNRKDEYLTPQQLNLSKDHPMIWGKSFVSKTWYDIQMQELNNKNEK